MFADARARAVDAGYAAGWGLVKAAPYGLTRRAFAAAGSAAAARNGAGTQQLRKNLRRVLGPDAPDDRLDEVVAAGLRSYARYWLETFRLPRMDHHDVAERVDAHMTGADHLAAALDAGRGAVVALPHTGNWDVAGIWLVSRHGRFTTVAERLSPESLFDRFVAYRESLGFEIVPLTGGQGSPVGVLKERLRANGVVCLLADRDLSHSGVDVDLFGEPARLPGGPALLAATTGAALLPAALWFEGDDWGQAIGAPIPVPEGRLRDQVRELTQALARVFEVELPKHLADWHMLQRLWLADLAPTGRT